MTYNVTIETAANGIKTASLFLNTDCKIMIEDAKFSMQNEIKGIGEITVVSIMDKTMLSATIK
jgi:hypothetical protein